MRRASSRFLPPFAGLAGPLLLILAAAIAGHSPVTLLLSDRHDDHGHQLQRQRPG